MNHALPYYLFPAFPVHALIPLKKGGISTVTQNYLGCRVVEFMCRQFYSYPTPSNEISSMKIVVAPIAASSAVT